MGHGVVSLSKFDGNCQAMWTCLNRGGVDVALLPVVIDRFS